MVCSTTIGALPSPRILAGLGVALTFPVLSAAAVAGLPPERFGVGGAVNQTARQMGAVLGVALLVAIIGTPTSPGEALDAFRQAWLLCAAAALTSAAIATRLRRVEAVVPEPAVVAVEPVTAGAPSPPPSPPVHEAARVCVTQPLAWSHSLNAAQSPSMR